MKPLKWTIKKLLKFPVIRKLVVWSKKNTIKGFHGIPVYYVLRSFFYALAEESPIDRAAAMTFKFFMAFFPFILFLCTLIPIVPIKGFQDSLLQNYTQLMPPQVSELLQHTIEQVVNQANTGLMSISFVIAFFFSTNGIVGMIRAMNASANISEPGGKMRLKALGILSFVFLTTVASILLLVLIGKLINQITLQTGLEFYSDTLKYIFRVIVLYLIVFSTISLIYYLAPARQFRLGFFSPGAILACNLSIISSVGIAEFFSNFDRYNTLYGTLGSIPIFLTWIFVNCLVLLAGFELNAGVAVGKISRQAEREKTRMMNHV